MNEDTFLLVKKITKDMRLAALHLSKNEARFLVDAYYQVQDFRIQTANQLKSMEDANEPHNFHTFILDNFTAIESQIKYALDKYSESTVVGRWSRSVCGIGPVIAAGLECHIDIKKAPTPGHIYSFAGLHPNQVWMSAEESKKLVNEIVDGKMTAIATREEIQALSSISNKNIPRFLNSVDFLKVICPKEFDAGAKSVVPTKKNLIRIVSMRPFNSQLKTLCWKIGESFVKVSGNKNDVYGKLYLERKAIESERNEQGLYEDQAEMKLDKFKIGKDTEAYKAYANGKLPLGHLHARAKRWAVKLFLSHWWYVAYKNHYKKEPPLPYPIAHMGHVHMIDVPNADAGSQDM